MLVFFSFHFYFLDFCCVFDLIFSISICSLFNHGEQENEEKKRLLSTLTCLVSFLELVLIDDENNKEKWEKNRESSQLTNSICLTKSLKVKNDALVVLLRKLYDFIYKMISVGGDYYLWVLRNYYFRLFRNFNDSSSILKIK